jgi:hypothetical protein
MTYDPFQTYATLGASSGIGNPFQTQINPLQGLGTNPSAVWNPLTAYQQSGYIGSPFNPQTALWQNPAIFTGLQHGAHHQVLQQLAQQVAAQHMVQQIVAQQLAQQLAQQIASQQLNPFGQSYGFQSSLGNPQSSLYPQIGQIGFSGHGINPFGSPFNQTGVPLAPQSWVGQAGQFGVGQASPVLLAQLTARALQAQGMPPGVGFQG